MSDLIDRQALRDAMYHEAMERFSYDQKWDSGCWIRYRMFERVLDSMPSAPPEIIRCKDCKHRYIEDMTWHCPFGLMGGEDFFCGYGSFGNAERKTE